MATTVPAGEFKATCLALLDQVAERNIEIVVTKRGRPVARLVPIADPRPVRGSVSLLVADEELMFSSGEAWSVDN